jgi:hypothetical protein
MNSGSRSSAINILFTLTLIFYAAAIGMSILHVAEPIIDHAWGAFEGMSGALLLILKADSDHANPQNPIPPANPANPTQK